MSEAQGGRRVVVTGLGVISSIGTGRAEFLAGLRAGRCGAGPLTRIDTTGFEYGTGYEVPDGTGLSVLERIRPDRHGRVSAQVAAVARMAVADAGLDLARVRDRPGLVAVGTTSGEALDVDDLAVAQIAGGVDAYPEALARRAHAARLSSTVVAELELPNAEAVTISTVCASGNCAVGYGLDAIRLGDADFALCGGGDAIGRAAFAGFYRIRAWAPEQVRPFDRNREGFMLGDGAGMLVLENLEDARDRGAPILAEVAGLHLNCDAEHPTKPSPERVAECLSGALDDAGVAPGEIDAVFAHGTGTRLNDAMEVDAVHRVFGRQPPPVTALKSLIGHTAGAAGAHSCIAGVLGLVHGFIPPTVNFANPAPDCPIDCVPNVAREASLRAVLVNTLGLGGQNAAVVLREPEGR